MLRLVAKNVEGEVVSNCGHFLPEEDPAVIVRHILAMASNRTSTSKDS
jgi:pimeloyl-ACP methyl ester carboxylesterase